MRISRRNSFLFVLIIFLTMILEGDVLSQRVPKEYRYKKRDDRFEGVRRGQQIAGERLELLSAVIKYQEPSLFRVDDFTNPANLLVKLRDAQDLLSQYLREQFSPDMQQLLDEYDESNPPSEALQKALVDELNQLLKGDSLYDEQRFSQVALTDKTRKLVEQNPQGRELIRLNRLLLEEVYTSEIAKSRYLQKTTHAPEGLAQKVLLKPIEKLNLGFLLNADEAHVDITVREYDRVYYMKPINTEYNSGFDKFSWDASIINALKIDWHVLHAAVKIKGKGKDIITPAILYDALLPGTLKVEEYRFVFVPNVKGDVKYEIMYNEEVKFQGSLEQQPARQQIPITWQCQDAGEGWYQLLITFRFKLPFRPSQEISTSYEFYHKPELDIPDSNSEIPR